jgi:hypothetical protein
MQIRLLVSRKPNYHIIDPPLTTIKPGDVAGQKIPLDGSQPARD